MIGYSRIWRWSAMLLYPSGQMSDCFTNVNVICITQTFEFINYIGQQRQGSTAFQWKIIFYFERCENNSNVNTIIFFEQFLEFPTKYDGWESNIGYEENGLYPVLFDFRILDTLITFVIHKSSQAWSEQVLRILNIKFKKPTINRQLYSQGSSFVLNVF